jgi:hypothetical protein
VQSSSKHASSAGGGDGGVQIFSRQRLGEGGGGDGDVQISSSQVLPSAFLERHNSRLNANIFIIAVRLIVFLIYCNHFFSRETCRLIRKFSKPS